MICVVCLQCGWGPKALIRDSDVTRECLRKKCNIRGVAQYPSNRTRIEVYWRSTHMLQLVLEPVGIILL